MAIFRSYDLRLMHWYILGYAGKKSEMTIDVVNLTIKQRHIDSETDPSISLSLTRCMNFFSYEHVRGFIYISDVRSIEYGLII